jgi:hypothetical protein
MSLRIDLSHVSARVSGLRHTLTASVGTRHRLAFQSVAQPLFWRIAPADAVRDLARKLLTRDRCPRVCLRSDHPVSSRLPTLPVVTGAYCIPLEG